MYPALTSADRAPEVARLRIVDGADAFGRTAVTRTLAATSMAGRLLQGAATQSLSASAASGAARPPDSGRHDRTSVLGSTRGSAAMMGGTGTGMGTTARTSAPGTSNPRFAETIVNLASTGTLGMTTAGGGGTGGSGAGAAGARTRSAVGSGTAGLRVATGGPGRGSAVPPMSPLRASSAGSYLPGSTAAPTSSIAHHGHSASSSSSSSSSSVLPAKITSREEFARREALVHRAASSAVHLAALHDPQVAAGVPASLLLSRGEAVRGPVPLSKSISRPQARPPFSDTAPLARHPHRGSGVPGARSPVL